MQNKIIIPHWMADDIKMHLLFPSSIFWVLDETYGKDQWKFADPPTKEEIEKGSK